ncbi:Do family serine endopeptidase [Planctomycetota bacterium]
MKRTLQLGIIGGLLGVLVVSTLPVHAKDPVSINNDESHRTLRNMGKSFASIAENASPAVVGVKAEKTYAAKARSGALHGSQMPLDNDFFERFFGPQGRSRAPQREQEQPRQTAQGTGFLVSADGYILTNDHLVGSEDGEILEKVLVKLADGHEVEAKVIGTDPDTDVAVIKIEGKNHPYIELADSDALEVGEWVVAIGNPFGFTHTVTSGIVSAKGRNVNLTSYDDFIQTDAAINPGNSGGPLLNLDSKVVGINSAIYGPRANIGIGLAIPINLAKSVYDQLVETGEVSRGFLGVSPADLSYGMARKLKLDEPKGAQIQEVTEDSAADHAGFKPYDVVLEFDGEPVKDAQDFRHKVAQVKPGEKVKILIARDGQERTLTAVLDRRSDAIGRESAAVAEKNGLLGIEVRNLTDDLAGRYGFEDMGGVLITNVQSGSDAYRKGLRPGMLIIEAEFELVKNAQQFKKLVEQVKSDEEIVLRVYNGRQKNIVSIKRND